MRIVRLEATNWRNFKTVAFDVEERLFIVGPNASGKSNLLDIFRFLSDLAASDGGLSSAIERRGGLSKVRSLFARNHARGRLIVDVTFKEAETTWRYRLAIRGESGGLNRTIVDEELVEKDGEILLSRPDNDDEEDRERLTQTHLEQISANRAFRPIAEYLARVQYFHLVPQIIRDPQRLGLTTNDPFGSDFIAQISATPPRTRDAWLRRMQQALQAAVPGFESLTIDTDPAGHPHLIAGYKNWRSKPAKQNESDFSDGTLRLIGLLWSIIKAPSNPGVLLLEEPELSLNNAIVRMLPTVLAQVRRSSDLQILVSTHAPEILNDEGVSTREVLVLQTTTEGTRADLLANLPQVADLQLGLSMSEIVDGLIAPEDLDGLTTAARSPR